MTDPYLNASSLPRPVTLDLTPSEWLAVESLLERALAEFHAEVARVDEIRRLVAQVNDQNRTSTLTWTSVVLAEQNAHTVLELLRRNQRPGSF